MTAIDRAKLRKLATVTLLAEPNDYAYTDDMEDDQETVEWIKRELASGNEWAWCMACVRVTYGDWTEETYLGGCSYENEKSFREGGYFDDMVSECVEAIADRMERARMYYDDVMADDVARVEVES